MRRALLPILLACAFLGCTTSSDIQRAEVAVEAFHAMLDREQFEAIWFQGSTDFQKAVAREEFVAYVSAVHRKLGTVKSARQNGWRAEYGGNGKIVALAFDTEFAEGKAHEEFAYRLDGDVAQLVQYAISSNVLVIK